MSKLPSLSLNLQRCVLLMMDNIHSEQQPIKQRRYIQPCVHFSFTWLHFCSFSQVLSATTVELNLITMGARQVSFSNPYIASLTSQLILQTFRRFTYVTAHSTTLLLLHLRHKHFTYVSWRAPMVIKFNLTVVAESTWENEQKPSHVKEKMQAGWYVAALFYWLLLRTNIVHHQ